MIHVLVRIVQNFKSPLRSVKIQFSPYFYFKSDNSWSFQRLTVQLWFEYLTNSLERESKEASFIWLQIFIVWLSENAMSNAAIRPSKTILIVCLWYQLYLKTVWNKTLKAYLSLVHKTPYVPISSLIKTLKSINCFNKSLKHSTY